MLIEINGIKLHYHDEGEGLPILLIHAFPLSGAMWDAQREELRGDYRILTPDLRGFGQSEAPEGSYTMDQQADDMRALLDQAGIDKAVLCGLSMGGYIALAFARRYPDRLAGLILADTRAGADDEQGKQNRDRLAQLARDRGAAAVAGELLPKMFTTQTFEENPGLIASTRYLMESQPVNGIVGALLGMRDRPDSTPMLGQIRVPALIIVGDQDQLTPLSHAQTLQQGIPGARLEQIENASHLSNMERPAAFNQVLRSFLDPLRTALLQRM
ncbi:MAG: alpha/beta hydrolase [Herpetosiphonaceae bacterium]|nr:MAG: alpha/beta hydrolase [Herpetosiphonaceae bacterium]